MERRRTAQPPVLLISTAFPVLVVAVTRRTRRRTVLAGSVTVGSVLPPLGGVTERFTALTPVTRPAVLAVLATSSAV